jgi:hypothetical protein
MIALLTTVALAQDNMAMDMAPCMDPYVVSMFPEAGDVDVPMDMAPAFIWASDCGLTGEFQMVLELDGERIAETRVDADGSSSGMGRLFPDAQLEAEAEYRVVISGGWDEQEVLFTTGTELSQPTSAPEGSNYRVEAWDQGGGTFSMSITLSSVGGEDPDGQSLLVLRDSEDGVVAASTADAGGLWFNYTVDGEPTEEVCVSLTQEDASGLASEAQEFCMMPIIERGGGCTTAPVGVPLVALFGLALGLRRRKVS